MLLDNNTTSTGPSSSSDALTSSENGVTQKRKRRPAGTPGKPPKKPPQKPKLLFLFNAYIHSRIDFNKWVFFKDWF